MFKLFSVVVIFFATSTKLLSQDISYPEGKQLQHFKLKQSCSFSMGKLQKRMQLAELKILDTLANANCFLVETKHRNGNFAILKKKKKRYQLVFLNFKDFNAKPYFTNDSIDFNRDNRTEIIVYYTATVTALPGFSTYNGTKTGIQIINVSRHRALVSCNMSLCGLGTLAGSGLQTGACSYQYSMSFMPMRLVITSFTEKETGQPLLPPQISGYLLKRKYFERDQ